jgi:hypothetical protein
MIPPPCASCDRSLWDHPHVSVTSAKGTLYLCRLCGKAIAMAIKSMEREEARCKPNEPPK